MMERSEITMAGRVVSLTIVTVAMVTWIWACFTIHERAKQRVAEIACMDTQDPRACLSNLRINGE